MSATGTTFETFSGTFIDYANPRAEDVHLADVAHALAHVCRFAGHSRTFYSVAEHAILCARLLRELDYHPSIQLAALHHDSHEAYLGDMPTPLKKALGPRVPVLALALDVVIAEAFGVDRDLFYSESVKWADTRALAIEVTRLKRCGVGGDWPWGDELPEVKVPYYFVPGRPMADVEYDFIRIHRELAAEVAALA